MKLLMSVVIVPFGEAKYVVAAANDAGAKGATILHARGRENPKKEVLFHLHIEPEQEIVLIVATKEVTSALGEKITKQYRKTLRNAAVYVLPVNGMEDYVG